MTDPMTLLTGTRQGGKNVVADEVFEVAGVDRGWFGPADHRDVGDQGYQGQHDGAYGIDVLDGVEGDAAHHAGRLVAETGRHPSMR